MPRILIDANKYLEFYQSAKIAELINLLIDLKHEILVTSQIVDEVNRNRVSVSQQFLLNNWHKNSLHYTLPSHLLSLTKDDLEKLQKRVSDFANISKALSISIHESFLKTIKDVAASTDPVSIGLSRLFDSKVAATGAEMLKARVRKEIGNPPGKRSDPLGDQITWEQFLSRVKGNQTVWIITGDSDYRYELVDGTLILNPVLQADLNAVNGGVVEVRCFKTLSDGLKDYISSAPAKPASTPTDQGFTDIKKAEVDAEAMILKPSVRCPACGSSTPWNAVHAVQGYYGGLLFFTCPVCGRKFDTDGP